MMRQTSEFCGELEKRVKRLEEMFRSTEGKENSDRMTNEDWNCVLKSEVFKDVGRRMEKDN